MPLVLEGFKELLSQFDAIESRVARKKILAASMRKGLRPTLEQEQQDAPYRSAKRIAKYSRIAVLDQTSYSVLGKVGVTSQGFIGYFHEWGTVHMHGRPFLGPAWERTQTADVEIIGENLYLGIIGELVEQELDGI